MITKEEIYQVGQTGKTHGIKGELSVSFSKENFDESSLPYYIFEVDGLLVPFFVESFRFKTNTTALIKFEGITTEEDARMLCNQAIYIHQNFVLEKEEEELGLESLIGHKITDTELGDIGIVTEIDDTTDNILFIVTHAGNELLIPVANEFILDINPSSKTIHMKLPKGLVDLDQADEE